MLIRVDRSCAEDPAAALDVDTHTLLEAYDQLRSDGAIEMRRGRGVTVVDQPTARAELVEITHALARATRRSGLTRERDHPGGRGASVSSTGRYDGARRLIAGVALPATAIVVTMIAFLATSDPPDPIATHRGLDGRPDDAMARSLFIGLFGTLVVAAGAPAFASTRRTDIARGELGPPVGPATFLQWRFTGVVVAVTVANQDADTWREADDLSPALVLVVLLGAAAVASWPVRSCGRWASRHRPRGTSRHRRRDVHPASDWYGDSRSAVGGRSCWPERWRCSAPSSRW